MKSCNEYEELVSAYVDGEAGDEETAELFLHLGGCRSCRAFIGSVLKLEVFLKSSDTLSTARTSAERHRIAAPAEHARKRTPVWKRKVSMTYPAAAAVIFAIVLSGMLLFFRNNQSQSVSGRTQTEYVYVTLLAPVDVIATPLPPPKTN